MAEEQQQHQLRSATNSAALGVSSTSSLRAAAASGRLTAVGVGNGGGPMRATRCFSLRPSPSTPALLTAVATTTSASTLSEAILVSALSTSASASWGPFEGSAMASASGLIRGGKALPKPLPGLPSFTTRSPTSLEPMRRSASLDTVATSYLSGRWPYHHHNQQDAATVPVGTGCMEQPGPIRNTASANLASFVAARPIMLTFDKSTQTHGYESYDYDGVDEDCTRHRTQSNRPQSCLQSSCENALADSRLRCGGKSRGVTPAPLSSSKSIAIPTSAQHDSLVPCQGSAEDFNQEIERLVHNGRQTEHKQDLSKVRTPDGHRAPIADQLLATRNVDTQTPSGRHLLPSSDRLFPRICAVGSSDDDSPLSTLPIIPSDGGVASFSPEPDDNDTTMDDFELCSSPMFAGFVNDSPRRLSPEGREWTTDVKLGSIEHWHGVSWDDGQSTSLQQQQQQPSPTQLQSPAASPMYLIPSERSAFCPLLKKYIGHRLTINAGAVGAQ